MSERRLKGRYELQSVLGRGLATTTHLALDHESGERCVVKVLSLASADALKAHELLTREARVLQRLDHPRIPRLVDFFSEEDGPDTRVCLVQQHVEGKSLYELVRAGRRFSESGAIAMGVKLARVLEYLHGFEPPILHRDLKPANVLVTPGERVYLVDFGAVRDHLPHEMLHPSGPTIVGTRGYMPIEQFEGHAVPGSDLYALGATLVFALSGKEPAELGKQGLRLDVAPHLAVSPELSRLLGRLLEPDWRERPLSATEVREELERIAAQPKRARSQRRPLRRAPFLTLALVAGLGLLILVLSRTGRRAAQGPAAGPAPAATIAPGGLAPAEDAAGLTPLEDDGSLWPEWLSWPKARRDAFGDPLPPHAQRRLGTVRLRHGGPVRAVAFTPDGASIVSAGSDGSVSVWSAASGEERRRFEMGAPAEALALSPDGSRMLVGAERFWTARLFELAGRPIARLLPAGVERAPSVAVSGVAWSSDGRVVATRTYAAIDIWSGSDGQHRRRFPACGFGRGLAFVGSGETLCFGCQDGSARVLDAATGAERRLKLQSSQLSLEVSPDGRLVAQADYQRIQLVDPAAEAVARSLSDAELQASAISAFSFAPDGKTGVAGLASGRLVVWDLATGARRRVLGGDGSGVRAVAVSRDGRSLVSGGEDGTLRLFDLGTGDERLARAAHRGGVHGLDFLPGTSALVSAGADATLRRWERSGREQTLRTFDRPAAAVFALSDSRVAALTPSRVHVYDVASGWEVASVALPSGSSGAVASPRRGLLAVSGASTLDVVELETGRRRSFPVPRPEQALAFSPDGGVVASLRVEPKPLDGSRIVLRDASSGAEVGAVRFASGGPGAATCRSADGSYLLHNGGLWRVRGRPKPTLEGVGWPGGTRLCAVSPDGRFVALSRDADAIEVRERVQGSSARVELRSLGTLRGHRGPVTSLVFAPDSRTLVSGGADTCILVWDLGSLRSPAEAAPRPLPRSGPRLRLTFDEGIEGTGVTTLRTSADSPLQLVSGRLGRALAPGAPLAFPETRAIITGDEFTLTLFFRLEAAGLGAGAHQVLTSELATLDVRDGGNAHLFFHFLRQGGHVHAELTPWIGRVAAGRWYHVGASYRRSDGVVRVCVDGVCGSKPVGANLSDRLGELTLGRMGQGPNLLAIDELAIYDRALSDDEIAARAGLARAVPLPTPTPPPTPTPLPRLPAEQEPLPREGLPEGRDVAAHVSVEERGGFTVYRFSGPLARAQTLDVDLGLGAVWTGTSLGLLRHDPRSGSWRLWDETSGLPGARLNEIAVAGGRVIVDSSTPTTPGNVRGTGVLAFEVASRSWTPLKELAGGVWDLWADGSALWVGTGNGAVFRDFEAGRERRFTRAAGELVHDAVHAVRRHGETVAFAAMGDWVKDKKDHEGGGVTLWDRRGNQFRSYAVQDGLARGYSCDVFLDDADVFVAHWDEERGLSRIDRRTGRVEVLRRSANDIELGGVVLAGERETLWIGQQGALVRLDRASRQATALRERDGLPGYIVSGIAIGEDAVWASVYAYGRDGVRSAGLVRFERR